MTTDIYFSNSKVMVFFSSENDSVKFFHSLIYWHKDRSMIKVTLGTKLIVVFTLIKIPE